jgi:hypothetical protein
MGIWNGRKKDGHNNYFNECQLEKGQIGDEKLSAVKEFMI